MATQLINERQETMFDTKLTKAADDFTKCCMEVEAWKKKRIASEKDLIEQMERLNCKVLTLPQNKKLEYKYVDAKKSVVIKDFKPKVRRFRRNRRA